MSNMIPPLLSSSPPPMIGAVLEDDEFGSFAIASDLHCDSDVLPPTTEGIYINEIAVTNGINDFEELCSNNTNIENRTKIKDNTTKYNSFQYFPDIPPDILTETNEISNLDDVVDVIAEQEINEILDNKLDINKESPRPPSMQDEDFADFHTFTDNLPESFTKAEVHNAVDVRGDDDDFGDFNDYSLQTQPMQSIDIADIPLKAQTVVDEMFPVFENVTEEYFDEDFTINNVIFTQLKDITDTSALSYQWSKSNSQHFLLQALNIDTRNILYGPRWNESMPRYAATLGYTPLEPVKSDGINLNESGDLVPQIDIPSAEFDWVGSGLTNPLENSPASTMLLDLEQLVASLDIQYSSSRTPKSQNSPSHVDDIDDWEFWLRLTPKKIVERRPTDLADYEHSHSIDKNPEIPSLIQTQNNDDNESIKSLKFIDNIQTEKIDLDDFNCFQSNKTEFDWPVSLRETHISNVKVDEPSWLKPTILTPDLPRKEPTKGEEEFADFQSGTCADVPERTEPPLNEDDDEFTEFQSTTCLPPQPPPIIPEPLQPSILQPTKAAVSAGITPTSTAINWPDPGITDEELQRFSLSYKPSATEPAEIKQTKDEDEWTDFVSNGLPNNNKLPQNCFQKSLVSNQYVVLAAQPDEIDDEWSEFVSSKPPSVSEIANRLTRPPVSKLNLDWNGPPQFSSWSTSITPNIITNPASFESFQTFTSFDGDLLKNRIANKKNPSIMIQPRKNTVPSISTIPDLEFIAPKNRTWKK